MICRLYDLDITHELLDSVSSARKHFLKSQKERSLAKEKLNTKATLLNSTISDLQKSSDKAYWTFAEKNKLLNEK